jgi:hypothetical protein
MKKAAIRAAPTTARMTRSIVPTFRVICRYLLSLLPFDAAHVG